jgi:predicted nucleic-acid-binding Zn-ribbon protein
MSDGCVRCGSTKIIPRVPFLDHYGDSGCLSQEAEVEVAGVPTAIFFKDRATGNVYARICAECGYTELFTSNAQELYEKHLKAEGERG